MKKYDSKYRVFQWKLNDTSPKKMQKLKKLKNSDKKNFWYIYQSKNYYLYGVEIPDVVTRKEFDSIMEQKIKRKNSQVTEILPRPRSQRGFVRFLKREIYESYPNKPNDFYDEQMQSVYSPNLHLLLTLSKTLPPSQLGIRSELQKQHIMVNEELNLDSVWSSIQQITEFIEKNENDTDKLENLKNLLEGLDYLNLDSASVQLSRKKLNDTNLDFNNLDFKEVVFLFLSAKIKTKNY